MNRKIFGCLLLIIALIFVNLSGTLDFVNAEETVREITADSSMPIDLIDNDYSSGMGESHSDYNVTGNNDSEESTLQLTADGKATEDSKEIWADIEKIENSAINNNGGLSKINDLKSDFFVGLFDQIEKVVSEWDGYASGTLGVEDGSLGWTDKWGMRHSYSPSMRLYKYKNLATLDNKACALRYNSVTKVTKNLLKPEGGVIFDVNSDNITFYANDVVVFAPYSHLDAGFATEDDDSRRGSFYVGKEIAEAISGKCYMFTQEYVTPKRIAEALKKCRVVIYDGHGKTDKSATCENPTTSYIEMFSIDISTLNEFLYSPDSNKKSHIKVFYDGDRTVYCIDGNVIEHEMGIANACNNFFWIGACYSMATNGAFNAIQGPFKKDVELVLGYTRVCGCDYDYSCLNMFWRAMIDPTENGETTVKDAAATMWDIIGGPGNSNETELKKAYPRFVSSLLQDAYPAADDANFSYIQKWHPPQSDWKLRDFDNPGYKPDPDPLPDPNPDPNSNLEAFLRLDPMGLSYFPQINGYPRSYYRLYRDTYGQGDDHDCIHRTWANYPYAYGIGTKFLRYDWEVNSNFTPAKAYAVFTCNNGFSDRYAKIHNPKDGYGSNYVLKDTRGELDEMHNTCVRVEVELTPDENGILRALLPYTMSPDHSTHTEYYKNPAIVTPDRCDVIFDHWEFSGNTGTPNKNKVQAKAVYYNRLDSNGFFSRIEPVIASISEENGKLIATATGLDQVTRTTVIPWVDESHPNDNYFGWDAGCEQHCWIYDGVDHWETDEYNSFTGEGAWVWVKYHCAHGCKYDQKHPLTFKIPAKITSDNANHWNNVGTSEKFEFTAFVGQNKYVDGSLEMRGGLDGWTRFIQTTIEQEPDLSEFNWYFQGFKWTSDQTVSQGAYKNVTAVARFDLKNSKGATAETKEVNAIVIKAENSRAHTYQAVVTAKDSPDGKDHTSQPQFFDDNHHHWVFDGFDWPDGDGVPWDMYANYHCDHCLKTFQWYLWEVFPSGFWRICGHDAPLVTAYIDLRDAIDNELQHEERVRGHSDEEWEFKGFEWKTTGEISAEAIYYYDLSREANLDQTLFEDMPASDRWELIEIDGKQFLKFKVRVKPERVKFGRSGLVVHALPKYKASITAAEAPDGIPNQETKTIIPGVDPGVKPGPVDDGIIAPPENKDINRDLLNTGNLIFQPISPIIQP